MIAFDTNVLIYAADGRVPAKQEAALRTIESSRDGVVLWQVACEYIAASRKLSTHGLTADVAWDQLALWLARFPLICPSDRVLILARELHVRHRLSFWDAMIHGACLEAGVTRLYSEDLPGLVPAAGFEVVNPFA